MKAALILLLGCTVHARMRAAAPAPVAPAAPLAAVSPVLDVPLPLAAPAGLDVPVLALPPAQAVPAAAPEAQSAAAARPAPEREPRETLLEALGRPLPDLSESGTEEASGLSGQDFLRRAQLSGESAPAVPLRRLLDPGAPPTERALRAVIADELRVSVPRLLGRALSSAEEESILAQTAFQRRRWWSWLFSAPALADGMTDAEGRITLYLNPGWERMSDLETHLRVLFTHELTHRLERTAGLLARFGSESLATAAHLLRGLELLGLEGLRAAGPKIATEHELEGFEQGRRWAGPREGEEGLTYKGALAGAAYALARRTGRPADAWEFLRRMAEERAPAAARVFAEILLRRPARTAPDLLK